MKEKDKKPERYDYEQQENYIDNDMDEPIIEDAGDVDPEKLESCGIKPVDVIEDAQIWKLSKKRKEDNDTNFEISEEEYYKMSESMFEDRAESLIRKSERLYKGPDIERTYKEINYSEKIKYVNALKMFLTSLLELEEIASYVGYELEELEALFIANKWDKVKNNLYPHFNQTTIDYLEKNTTEFILKYDKNRTKAAKRLGNYITSLAFSEIRANPKNIRARDLLAAAAKFSEYQVDLEKGGPSGNVVGDDEAIYGLLLSKGSKLPKSLPHKEQEIVKYLGSQQEQADYAMDVEIIE